MLLGWVGTSPTSDFTIISLEHSALSLNSIKSWLSCFVIALTATICNWQFSLVSAQIPAAYTTDFRPPTTQVTELVIE